MGLDVVLTLDNIIEFGSLLHSFFIIEADCILDGPTVIDLSTLCRK